MRGRKHTPLDMNEIVPPSPDTGDRAMQARIAESLFGARTYRLRVAHFEVERRVGAGGMGTVFEATDTRLGRKVALKRVAGDATDALQNRLLAEAQALAKLSHPNVVQVYEVFECDHNVYIAMEFVEGSTLSEWQKQEGRTWREVLDVYVQAGCGLSAAHAEGIIHRDFKPKNVLVGSNGRVRVADFGLAKAIDLDGSSSNDEDSSERNAEANRRLVSTNDVTLEYMGRSRPSPSDEADDTRDRPMGITERQGAVATMTRTGMRLGTPEYMAPEQFEGGSLDARTDQFGFCVALYEALYGERPFSADTVAELAVAVCSGRTNTPPSNSSVPRWILEVLLRGLARSPSERFESMQALLDALASDPVPRRRKQWIVAATFTAAVGLVWGVATVATSGASSCIAAERHLEGVWDNERQAAVERAIMETELSYSVRTWALVRDRLNAYVNTWVHMRREACSATDRGEQSPQLLELRMACLDRRLQALRAMVELLEQTDPVMMANIGEAVSNLPALNHCTGNVDALLADHMQPTNVVVFVHIAALERQLAIARAHQSMGRHTEGLAIIEDVVEKSAKLGHEPFELRARLLQGLLERDAGNYAQAETTLEQVYSAAVLADLTGVAAEASATLVHLVGEQLARPPEGRIWAKTAEPLSRAVGSVGARTHYLNNIGLVECFAGNHEQCRAHHESALSEATNALGDRNPQVASALHNLGKLAWEAGDLTRATDYLEQALDMTEEQLGPGHRFVAYSAEALGAAAYHEGDYEAARLYFEQSLEIYQASLEPEHPDIAYPLINLSAVAASEGDLDEARSNLLRARDILEAKFGVDHPLVARVWLNLGYVEVRDENYSHAQQNYQRAATIFSLQLGSEQRSVADALSGLGTVHVRTGRPELARPNYARALQLYESALGPDHPSVAHALTGLGLTSLELGNVSDAIVHLERALLLRTSNPVEPIELAETRFALARGLWLRADEERARELATLGRTTYISNPSYAAELREVEVWLATRGG